MIEVSQHYALESDGERNYTILKKVVSKKDDGISYNRVAYYNNLPDALESIFRKETKKWIESEDGKEMRKIASELISSWDKMVKKAVEAVNKSGD